MDNSTLIRKVRMECPMCYKTHEVEERKRLATTTIKGEKVTYEETFYFCKNADTNENEFVTGSMMDKNLFNARNFYHIENEIKQTIKRIPFLITETEIE